jgi:hypothetical protein
MGKNVKKERWTVMSGSRERDALKFFKRELSKQTNEKRQLHFTGTTYLEF